MKEFPVAKSRTKYISTGMDYIIHYINQKYESIILTNGTKMRVEGFFFFISRMLTDKCRRKFAVKKSLFCQPFIEKIGRGGRQHK